VTNTLAYYDTATITAVKFFIVQAPGVMLIEPIRVCEYGTWPDVYHWYHGHYSQNFIFFVTYEWAQ
jgi:hypothetical protein